MTAWDFGSYMGENYGISKWGGFRRDYQEYKKRKKSEEMLKYIIEKAEQQAND